MDPAKKYSLTELLQIFDLTVDMTSHDLLLCKRKVMMMHPDKSPHLDASYFITYKRALEQIVDLYREMQKTKQIVPHETIEYTNEKEGEGGEFISPETEDQQRVFQREFNALFDREFNKKEGLLRAAERNAWFHNPDSDSHITTAAVKNQSQLGEEIEKFRVKQASVALVTTNNSLNTSLNNSIQSHKFQCASLYNTPDLLLGATDQTESESESTYVDSGNVFSELRYDDIRRVHNDETVIPVTQQDQKRLTEFRATNVDVLKVMRGNDRELYLSPEEELAVISMWEQHDKMEKSQILEKQFAAGKRSQEYETQHKSVMAHFLRLQS